MVIVVAAIAAASVFLIVVGLFYRFRSAGESSSSYADVSSWPEALTNGPEPHTVDDSGQSSSPWTQ